MDFEASTRLRVTRERAWETVVDLGTYPRWLGIVAAAEADPVPASEGRPAWRITLRARLGPLARHKTLRMVRSAVDAEQAEDAWTVRFDRAETDGRPHSAWVLSASLSPARSDHGTDLRMALHYGGPLWVPGLDLLLREEARQAGRRLDELLARGADPGLP